MCRSCKAAFYSIAGFNKHRVGGYGDAIYEGKNVVGHTKHTRGCMPEVDMLAKGMIKNERGIWKTGEFDASVFNSSVSGVPSL
jgi:hypothetical protein